MSKKYEDLIKNTRVNAECGEHMSPEEVTTLLNVVEARCAALAAENAGLKEACGGDGCYRDCPACAHSEYIEAPETPATDSFLAEVRAQGVEMAVDVVKQCYDNICAGGLQENREYEESIVQPHLDGIDDELKEIIAQLRKGVQS
ncbi:TPA: hypothetical protein ACP4YJ_000752 [Enterobacter cloacae]